VFGNKTFQKSRTTALRLAIVWLEEFALIALHTYVAGEITSREHKERGKINGNLNYSQQHNIIIYSLYGKGRKYTQAESAANYSAQRRTLLREIHKTFHLQLE